MEKVVGKPPRSTINIRFQIHRKLAAQSDKAMAALLRDLIAAGLLQETLVIIGGEFF